MNKSGLYRFVPTGFTTLDIMFGENLRNPDTYKLETINRGFEIGTMGIIAGEQGAGKSTLAIDAAAFALNMGFPCHKIIVFDADGEVYKENRIRNLTNLEDTSKISVYQEGVIEDIWDILVDESKEYTEQGYKPVEFYNPLIQRKIKMQPYTVVIIDTVSSLRSRLYSGDDSVKGAKNMFSNESYMQDYNKSTRLIKNMPDLFDKNVIFIWVAHIDDNLSMDGKMPERDFKSAPISKKISAPKMLKKKISWALALYKTIDTTDRDNYAQKENVITRLMLDSAMSPYSVLAKFWKSRTGTEGQTITELPNVATKFDRLYNLILDCDNLGIFKKAGGMYPTADMPHIFKDLDEASSKEMSSYKREAKIMDGYDRQFSILEARVLMDYSGDNPELINRKIKFISCALNNLEKRLAYELEVNNKSTKELETNVNKLKGLFDIIGKVERQEILNPDDVDMTPTASSVDEGDENDEE